MSLLARVVERIADTIDNNCDGLVDNLETANPTVFDPCYLGGPEKPNPI